MKLALGTAEFGLKYGLNNLHGKPIEHDVKAILGCAKKQGIDLIDTALAYGDAQSVIGRCLQSNYDFRLVSKLPSLDGFSAAELESVLENNLMQILAELNQAKLDTIMLHDGCDLLSEQADAIYHYLSALKDCGVIKNIGVSVYDSTALQPIIQRYAIDVVQLPLNIFNQHMLTTGMLQQLKQRRIEVHARSIFLQGMLLMQPQQLPDHLNYMHEKLNDYQLWLQDQKITSLQACLRFIAQQPEIDYAIVGVNSVRQLQDIIACQNDDTAVDCSSMAVQQLDWVDPRKWQINA